MQYGSLVESSNLPTEFGLNWWEANVVPISSYVIMRDVRSDGRDFDSAPQNRVLPDSDGGSRKPISKKGKGKCGARQRLFVLVSSGDHVVKGVVGLIPRCFG